MRKSIEGYGTVDAEKNARIRKQKRIGVQLDKDAAEAKRLGLSYGMYIAYKESGYLKTYERRLKREQKAAKQPANIIESSIVGAGNIPGRGRSVTRTTKL